jgi:hypothetical protein
MRDSYEDFILLRFRIPGTITHDTIAVSKSSLKKWVKKKVKSGKDINKLKLASADGKDGKRRDLVLTMSVWREWIIPNSKRLGSLYNETTENSTVIYRAGLQLKELKDDLPDLLRRIKYWVANLCK